MSKQAVFYLPTCEGLHEVMWQTSSAMIDSVLQICWKLFPFFLLARFISDEAMNRYNGVMDLKVHIKTLFNAFLITFFLANYKWILESFDSLIGVFDLSKLQILKAASTTQVQTNVAATKAVATKNISWYKPVLTLTKTSVTQYLTDKLTALLSGGMYYFQKGCIYLMHYAKAVLLMLTALVGPIAAIGTLLPSFMRSSFSTWTKSYVNISCWAITLNIFKAFIEAHEKVAAASNNFKDTLAYTLLSMVLIICIFLTPTITSKFIGSAIVPHLGNVMNQATNRGLKLLSSSVRGLTRGTSSLATGIGSLARGASKLPGAVVKAIRGASKSLGAAVKAEK